MAGRLGFDFGTSNSVVAAWDETLQDGVPVPIPSISRKFLQGEESVSVVPSLIHYMEDGKRLIGNQVIQQNLYQAAGTFRWMKSYISRRSPIKKNIHGKPISFQQAGSDFLAGLMLLSVDELNAAGEEIGLTLPVEAFEDYEDWLTGVAEEAGLPRFRVIDEPSAAALGYGAHVQPGNVYLVFDFGGGTLDISVVIIEDEGNSTGGRRCRVLGKAGLDLGGSTIDQWLFQTVLEQAGRRDTDEDVRPLSNALLISCEQAKERLSTHERAGVSVVNPTTGSAISIDFTRSQFEDILEKHNIFSAITRTIQRAINQSIEKGFGLDNIHSILMVGGSSQIPSIQTAVKRFFGKDKVLLNRPLDAIARGAAAFVAGVDFYDHIQHDYAIRYINREKGGYDYMSLVKAGTSYPQEKVGKSLTIKASYEGQEQLGLLVYEVAQGKRSGLSQGLELQFDLAGLARLTKVQNNVQQERSRFQIGSPTFLEATPPAQKGEPRFEVFFGIDDNKRLLVNVRDLKTDLWTHRDFPMVKLT